jgi:Uma2 family endonuclease
MRTGEAILATVSGPIETTQAESVGDLLKSLGHIPAKRVRVRPAIGTATEQDVINLLDHEGQICELIDGTLVEKVMGLDESFLTVWLIELLGSYVRKHRLGRVAAPDGPIRVRPGIVRFPDISYFSWKRLPKNRARGQAVAPVAPDLAVEIISKGNTPEEMKRKLREYFRAGVHLVWFIYPKTRTVDVYTSPTQRRQLENNQVLDGGDVVPGFRTTLRKLFSAMDLP